MNNELSFSRTIEIATQIEDAAKCAKETVYGTSTGSSQVKKIKKPNAPARPTGHADQRFRPKHNIRQDFPVGTCDRCEGPQCGKDCKFKNAVCRFCQKTGHIEKVCLQKRKFVSKIETLSTVKRIQNFPHLQQNSGTTLSHSKWIQEQATISNAQRSGIRWENRHCNR